jgi:hypothetical protein
MCDEPAGEIVWPSRERGITPASIRDSFPIPASAEDRWVAGAKAERAPGVTSRPGARSALPRPPRRSETGKFFLPDSLA